MKTGTHVTTPSHGALFGPNEAEIQHCAYFLWQQQGRPAGRDVEIWHAAKELLRHRPGHASSPATGGSHQPREATP